MPKLRMISDAPCFKSGLMSEEDIFNHSVFADTLLDLIKDNAPGLTIGLFGGWGIGKTSIINLFKDKLDNDARCGEFAYVYFNAWKYSADSFRRQFLLTVAQSPEIIHDAAKRDEEVERLMRLNHAAMIKKIREIPYIGTRGRIHVLIFAILVILGVMMVTHFSGVKGIIGQAAGFAVLVVAIITLMLSQLKQIVSVQLDNVMDPQLIFPEQFGKEFEKLLNASKSNNAKRKVVIVIDDLDRCDVDTINDVLVSLKNFLGTEDCYFIVPMDDSSVVQKFSMQNRNIGYEQLRKYFSVSIRIPALHALDIIQFATQTAKEYDIPADVAYIAALGNCRDARKMKYFLNLYKIKESIAEKRMLAGLLGNVDIQDLQRQLAKLVVIEYQFPEFFHAIVEKPEYLEWFTKAARGENIKFEPDARFQDILTQCNDDAEICPQWDHFLGLERFLCETDYVEIKDLDILARMKTSIHVTKLNELGLWLRQAVTSNADIKYSEHVNSATLAERSAPFTEELIAYTTNTITAVAHNASRIGLYVVHDKLLHKDEHRRLLQAVAMFAVSGRSNVRLTIDDAIIYMENLSILPSNLTHRVAIKIIDECLATADVSDKYIAVLNHDGLRLFATTLIENIDQQLRSRIGEFSRDTKLAEVITNLLLIRWNANERVAIGLNVPSEDFLVLVLPFLSAESSKGAIEMNNCISALLLSPNNPEGFPDTDLIEKRLVQVIKASTLDSVSNEPLACLINLFINIPRQLSQTYASELGTHLVEQYAPRDDSNYSVIVLSALLKCIISSDTSVLEALKTNFVTFATELPPKILDLLLIEIDRRYSDKNELVNGIVVKIINNRWEYVNANLANSTNLVTQTAALCMTYSGVIHEGQSRALLIAILGIQTIAAIAEWADYIVEHVASCDEEFTDEYMRKIIVCIGKKSLNKEQREWYLVLLIRLLKLRISKSSADLFHSLLELLSDLDSDLVQIVPAHYDDLCSSTGATMSKKLVHDLFSKILNGEQTDLGNYRILYDKVLLRHSMVAEQSSRLAQVIADDLPSASKTKDHRMLILEMTNSMKLVGGENDDLARVLYEYKEGGDDPDLRAQAFEKYDMLIRKKIIKPYAPTSVNNEKA